MKLDTLPTSFIVKNVSIDWSDVLWGYQQKLLGWHSVVEFAELRLLTSEGNDLEIELAGLGKNDTTRVSQLVHRLGSHKHDDGSKSKEKWLYLSLLWLYENRNEYLDPLSKVEQLYSDFGYPNSIAEFVRYMPATDGYDPSKHSKRANADRLYRKWQEFLHQQSNQWTVSSK